MLESSQVAVYAPQRARWAPAETVVGALDSTQDSGGTSVALAARTAPDRRRVVRSIPIMAIDWEAYLPHPLDEADT